MSRASCVYTYTQGAFLAEDTLAMSLQRRRVLKDHSAHGSGTMIGMLAHSAEKATAGNRLTFATCVAHITKIALGPAGDKCTCIQQRKVFKIWDALL